MELYDLAATGEISEKIILGIKSVFPDKKLLKKSGAVRLLDVEAERIGDLPVEVLEKSGIDAKWVPAGFSISRFKVMTLDMDSTLVENEVIEELGDYCGRGEEVRAMTQSVLASGLDFKGSLSARVECLKGASENIVEMTAMNLKPNPGAREWTRFAMEHGVKVYVVSAGFRKLAQRCVEMLGLSGCVCNELVVEDGILTGDVVGPAGGELLDSPGKRRTLEVLCMINGAELSEAIAGGDGSNDVQMITAAGLGYSYHGKPIVEKAADFRIRNAGHEAVMNLMMEAWEGAEEV